MENIAKYANIVKQYSEEQIEKYSQELLGILNNEIIKETDNVARYVEHLRTLNSGIDNNDLAKRIISRRAIKSGGIGAITNIGGLITIPITMPADLYLTFRVQVRMVLAIAYIYGWDIHEKEIATDVLLVMGGNGAMEALYKAGIKFGQEIAKKAVNKYITRDVMKKINRIISRKIITKAGEKSFTSFTKLVPIVGAPIGGAINITATYAVGKTALQFYKG